MTRLIVAAALPLLLGTAPGHAQDAQAAIEEGVPVPVLSAALYQRFSSRGAALFADKVLSAMRMQFGGHHERTADPTPDVADPKQGH